RVRHDGAEHRHVEKCADHLACNEVLLRAEVCQEAREYEADDPTGDECNVRRLQGRMSHGEEVRKVARAEERVRIAAVGVDEREKAGDQADESDQGQQRGPCARAEDRLEAVEQGSGRVAQVLRPAPDGGVQEKDQRSSYDEGGQAPDRGSRDVALWIMRLLGGKWQLFDWEEKPERERDGGDDGGQTKCQEPRQTTQ